MPTLTETKKLCLHCGQPLPAAASVRRRYCCCACKAAAGHARRSEGLPAIVCIRCGKEFLRHNPVQRFCSKACSNGKSAENLHRRHVERQAKEQAERAARRAYIERVEAEQAEREEAEQAEREAQEKAWEDAEEEAKRDTRRFGTPAGAIMGSVCGSRLCMAGCRLGGCGL